MQVFSLRSILFIISTCWLPLKEVQSSGFNEKTAEIHAALSPPRGKVVTFSTPTGKPDSAVLEGAEHELKALVQTLVDLLTRNKRHTKSKPLASFQEIKKHLSANNYEKLIRLCELKAIISYDENAALEMGEDSSFELSKELPASLLLENIKNVVITNFPDGDLIRASLYENEYCVDPEEWIQKRCGSKKSNHSEFNTAKIEEASTDDMLRFNQLGFTSEESFEVLDPHCDEIECRRRKDPNSCINRFPVSRQGCGTCWIHSMLLVFELIFCHKHNQVAEDFSETHMVRCFGPSACHGGNESMFLQKLNEQKVLVKTGALGNLPRRTPVANCSVPASAENFFKGWSIPPHPNPIFAKMGIFLARFDEHKFLDYYARGEMKKLQDLIKKEVRETGGIVMSKYMTGSLVGGTLSVSREYVENKCHITDTSNHMMVIVGYGTYQDKHGNQRKYYECRNSWGPNWGNEGYYRIDMDGPGRCNGRVMHSVAVVKANPPPRLLHPDYCKRLAPCKNDSECEFNPKTDTTYKCICKRPYGGKNCDEYDKSKDTACDDPDVCNNNGECIIASPGKAKCECAAGWAGKHCTVKNHCDPDPCERRQKCVNVEELPVGQRGPYGGKLVFCRDFTKDEKNLNELEDKLTLVQHQENRSSAFMAAGITLTTILLLGGAGYYVSRQRGDHERAPTGQTTKHEGATKEDKQSMGVVDSMSAVINWLQGSIGFGRRSILKRKKINANEGALTEEIYGEVAVEDIPVEEYEEGYTYYYVYE